MIEVDTALHIAAALSGGGLVSTMVLHIADYTAPKQRRRSAVAERLLAERQQQQHGLGEWLRTLTRVTPGELPDELPPHPTDPGEH